MGISVLIFFIAIAIFVLFFKMAMGYIGKVFGKTVYGRHKAAEHIVDTGRVPPEWRLRAEQALRKTGPPGSPSHRRTAEREQEKILKQIEGLLKYFDTAPVFEDEPTKRMLIGELTEAKTRWEETDAETLLLESTESSESKAGSDDIET